MKEPLVFSLPSCEDLAERVAKRLFFSKGSFSLERFLNEEIHLTLHDSVEGRECIVFGLINPPESEIFSFLALCHTLKKEKARRVIAVLPYLAYARHDKEERRKSRLAQLVGRLLQACGVDVVISADVHSKEVEDLFPIPLRSIPQEEIFQNVPKDPSMSLCFPDEGAVARSKDKKHAAYITKERTEKGILHRTLYGTLHGTFGKKVLVMDDILDTGETLLSCCRILKRHGVEEIVIIVTHGLFTKEKWKELFHIGVKKLFTTDSVPLPLHVKEEKRIVRISLEEVLTSAIKKELLWKK